MRARLTSGLSRVHKNILFAKEFGSNVDAICQPEKARFRPLNDKSTDQGERLIADVSARAARAGRELFSRRITLAAVAR